MPQLRGMRFAVIPVLVPMMSAFLGASVDAAFPPTKPKTSASPKTPASPKPSASATPAVKAMVLDRVTLRPSGPAAKGVVIAGILLPSVNANNSNSNARTSPLTMVIRRAWAEAELPPDLVQRWTKSEADVIRTVGQNTLPKLRTWRTERLQGGARNPQNDSILKSLDAWISRIENAQAKGAGLPPLMRVVVKRSETAKVESCRELDRQRAVLAWTNGIMELEELQPEDLAVTLEARGLIDAAGGQAKAKSSVVAVPWGQLEALLPERAYDETQWRLRRAATEVVYDGKSKFLRYGPMVFPEPAPGQGLNMGLGGAGGADLSNLVGNLTRELLGEGPPPDPIPAALKPVKDQGGIGALVTEMAVAPDASAVTVTITLYVYDERQNAWTSQGAQRAGVRHDDPAIARNAGQDLAADPQIAGLFQTFGALGLTVPEDAKRQALGVGAAAQLALSQARAALAKNLDRLAFPEMNK